MSRIKKSPANTVETPILLHSRHPHDIVNPAWNRLFPLITDPATGETYAFWSKDDGTRTGTKATGYFPPAAPSSQTVTSPTSTVDVEPPKKKHKRKFEAMGPDDIPKDGCPVLAPSMRTIISRCLPPPSAESSSSGSTGRTPIYGNYWSRETDLDNTRSNNPSDRELKIEKKREEARVKARIEAAAAKKSKKSGRRRGSATASASRAGSPEAEASLLSTALALAAPTAMKRTRSAGLAPISTILANALGTNTVGISTNTVGISSPLKAVTGPNTPEEAKANVDTVKPSVIVDPAPVRRGRSRLSGGSGGSDESPPNEPGSGRKANSHSPTTITIPLISEPGNGTSSANPLLKNASMGGIDMRRVVSTSNIGKKNGHSLEAARERSKREVILPGRLRDYDVKATTPAW